MNFILDESQQGFGLLWHQFVLTYNFDFEL